MALPDLEAHVFPHPEWMKRFDNLIDFDLVLAPLQNGRIPAPFQYSV
jgi:hypothetical protein